MKSTEQPRNINEAEIELIQRTFKGNEPLLKAVRALFLGLGTSDDEKTQIRATFSNPDLRAIMWRRFYPTLDRNSPMGQVQDVWLGTEEMVFGQNPDTVYQAVRYKEISLDLTKQALSLLDNPDLPLSFNTEYKPAFSEFQDRDSELQVRLLGRNQFIKHVEQQLLFLWLIAGQEPKPKAATIKGKEVINKDSTK